MKLTRRPVPPDFVLKARMFGSLALIFAYAGLRVPMLGISVVELACAWAGAAVLLWLFERSASELYFRPHLEDARRHFAEAVKHGRAQWSEPTEVIPAAQPWPGEVELAIAEARHEATHALIDQGRITEHLFTHDVLCEPTPPSGFSMYPDGGPDPFDVSDNEDAIRYATSEYVGRHRPEHIDRDRFGQLFGSL